MLFVGGLQQVESEVGGILSFTVYHAAYTKNIAKNTKLYINIHIRVRDTFYIYIDIVRSVGLCVGVL